MRVGLLTQWYDPEPGPAALPGVLARGLASRGHEVEVLTGVPNYPSGTVATGYRASRCSTERLHGVTVHRVPLFPSHDASAIRRAANYASFGLSSLALGAHRLSSLDAVWVNYSPITVAPAMWALRYLAGVPLVVHILDLWPDTIAASGKATGRSGRAALRAIDAWCAAMYRSAHSVAFISPGVGPLLAERGVPEAKLRYVPMWADEKVFHPGGASLRDSLGIPSDAIVLLYAGTLGVAQGLEPLIDACAQIGDRRFVCLIAGSGTHEDHLRARARQGGGTSDGWSAAEPGRRMPSGQSAASTTTGNIRFLGRLPTSAMTSLMATADLAYVSLNTHPLALVTLPSKTQAAFASGTPILAAAAGDLADVVRLANAGWVAPPGDATKIAATISSICKAGHPELARRGRNARAHYEAEFLASRGVQRIETLLQEATRWGRVRHGAASREGGSRAKGRR